MERTTTRTTSVPSRALGLQRELFGDVPRGGASLGENGSRNKLLQPTVRIDGSAGTSSKVPLVGEAERDRAGVLAAGGLPPGRDSRRCRLSSPAESVFLLSVSTASSRCCSSLLFLVVVVARRGQSRDRSSCVIRKRNKFSRRGSNSRLLRHKHNVITTRLLERTRRSQFPQKRRFPEKGFLSVLSSGFVAKWLLHRTCNAKVAGSNPTGATRSFIFLLLHLLGSFRKIKILEIRDRQEKLKKA